MYSSTSSFINTSRGRSLSMSRYDKASSVGAGFGRLSIQNDSDDEMVDTRSSAKKGDSSRSRDKGKSKAKPEPSRKTRDDPRKSRKTTSKGGPKRPSDDDSDDSDDSSSDDEDETTKQKARKKYYLRMAVSVLNPDLLSPTEFIDLPSQASSSRFRSQTLRTYADIMSQGLDDNGYNAVIAQNRPDSKAWGDMVSGILKSQKATAQKDFQEGEEDAIETLKRFDRIRTSIYTMFKNPMYINTYANAKKDFVFILADILNFTIRETQTRTGPIAYAGSLHGHERNIHQRFIHKDENWLRYMGMLIELYRMDGVPALFRETRVQDSLRDTWGIVCYCVSHAAPRAGPLGDFQDRLQQFLQALRIPCPRPATEG